MMLNLVFLHLTAIEDSTSLSPPDNLRAKILSPSTAWLQWVDPSLGRHQQITDNRYYNVHYQPLVGASKSLSVIVKALHVVLYDLLSGTRYTFKVRTVKDGNASDFSERVANRTFEKGRAYALQCYVSFSKTDIRYDLRTEIQPLMREHTFTCGPVYMMQLEKVEMNKRYIERPQLMHRANNLLQARIWVSVKLAIYV